jgi:hypothetical protein
MLIVSYTDIDTIISMSNTNKLLNISVNKNIHTFATQFKLSKPTCLTNLIKKYDMKYITVRSHNYWSLTQCLCWAVTNDKTKYYNYLFELSGSVNWNEVLMVACKLKKYDIINKIFILYKQNQRLKLKCPQILSCVSNDVDLSKYINRKILSLIKIGYEKIVGYYPNIGDDWTIQYKGGSNSKNLLKYSWIHPDVILKASDDVINWILSRNLSSEAISHLISNIVKSGNINNIKLIYDKYQKNISLPDIIKSGNINLLLWYIKINETQLIFDEFDKKPLIFDESNESRLIFDEFGKKPLIFDESDKTPLIFDESDESRLIFDEFDLYNAIESGNHDMFKYILNNNKINISILNDSILQLSIEWSKNLDIINDIFVLNKDKINKNNAHKCFKAAMNLKLFNVVDWLSSYFSMDDCLKKFKSNYLVNKYSICEIEHLTNIIPIEIIPWNQILIKNIKSEPEVLEFIIEMIYNLRSSLGSTKYLSLNKSQIKNIRRVNSSMRNRSGWFTPLIEKII